jgi:hypothetical protein
LHAKNYDFENIIYNAEMVLWMIIVPTFLNQVRVQSDPAGRLVISGEPEHPNNPWGVTPFKKASFSSF